MKNSEIVNKIIKTLEENHIDLYHNVSKEEVDNFISNIKNLDDLNEIGFDYQMKKLFALFKDSHTSYFVSGQSLIKDRILFVQNDFYVKHNNNYQRILKIGNILKDEYFSLIEQLINYDTKEWLNYCINNVVNNAYFYEMLGLIQDGKLQVELESGEVLFIDVINKDSLYDPKEQDPIYDYNILEDNILCVKYSRCKDDEGNPFNKFVEQVKNEIENKGIKKYILDVRGNKGGDSEVLNPLQELIVEKGLKGCVITNNGTFSSGRIAVCRFKEYAGAVVVGEATGGAVKSFGEVKNFKIGGKRFSCSTKLFDFTDVWDYTGSIQPDIFILETIEDIEQNRDIHLIKTIEYIKTL